jgi:hypothetical protein
MQCKSASSKQAGSEHHVCGSSTSACECQTQHVQHCCEQSYVYLDSSDLLMSIKLATYARLHHCNCQNVREFGLVRSQAFENKNHSWCIWITERNIHLHVPVCCMQIESTQCSKQFHLLIGVNSLRDCL